MKAFTAFMAYSNGAGLGLMVAFAIADSIMGDGSMSEAWLMLGCVNIASLIFLATARHWVP